MIDKLSSHVGEGFDAAARVALRFPWLKAIGMAGADFGDVIGVGGIVFTSAQTEGFAEFGWDGWIECVDDDVILIACEEA